MLLAVYLSRDKYAIFHSLMGSGYLIKSQEDKEITSCHVTLFTGSSFQETEYMHSLMVYICIWGHRIQWSFDRERLQNMALHKGLRPGPVMIFPQWGKMKPFQLSSLPVVPPHLIFVELVWEQLHWVHMRRSPSRAVRIRGLSLLYNLQQNYEPSPRVTVRTLMVSMDYLLASQCASV